MTGDNDNPATEVWFNPFLRVLASGFTLGSTRYGNARIAKRFAGILHHENDPVTVELVRLPTRALRERWQQQGYIRQTTGGFRYNAADSTLIYGRRSPLLEMYCQIFIREKQIRILFNTQYARYTFLRTARLPHPTRLAATLANIALIRQGVMPLHGAAIESQQHGVALLGFSRTGKTYSAVQLCQQDGWRLLADDVIIVNRDGMMFPNPFTTSQDFVKPVLHKLAGRLLKDGNERWGTLERYPGIKVGTATPVESIYILEKRAWGNGLQGLTASQAADRIMLQNALEFTLVNDPFVQRLAYFQDWHAIELFQAAHEMALAFASSAREIHELVTRNAESLVTTLRERLASNPPAPNRHAGPHPGIAGSL